MKKTKFVTLIFTLALLFSPGSRDTLYSFTDQANTERMIGENKHFIDFINITLTNFGDDKKEDFRKAYGKHFNAEVAFLQSDYPRAYKRVYSSQGDLVKIYEEMLKNRYLEDSKDILDKLAPNIIRSKNQKAKHYLTLGYRDRTVGWTHYTVGEATNPKQYSVKLFKYEEAVKMLRRSKRYGFLALYESQSNEMKKKISNHMLQGEKAAGNPFYSRFIDLKEDATIEEIAREFEDKERDKKPKEDDKGKKKDEEGEAFENLVLRRVRFKKERIVAKSLLNNEFDKADGEIRQYVKDYNYKLLISTFELLNEEEKTRKSDVNLNYINLKVHLMDNYQRLSKESVLTGIVGKVTVEDSLENIEKSKKDEDAKTDAKTDVKDKDKSTGKEPEKKSVEKDGVKKETKLEEIKPR